MAAGNLGHVIPDTNARVFNNASVTLRTDCDVNHRQIEDILDQLNGDRPIINYDDRNKTFMGSLQHLIQLESKLGEVAALRKLANTGNTATHHNKYGYDRAEKHAPGQTYEKINDDDMTKDSANQSTTYCSRRVTNIGNLASEGAVSKIRSEIVVGSSQRKRDCVNWSTPDKKSSRNDRVSVLGQAGQTIQPIEYYSINRANAYHNAYETKDSTCICIDSVKWVYIYKYQQHTMNDALQKVKHDVKDTKHGVDIHIQGKLVKVRSAKDKINKIKKNTAVCHIDTQQYIRSQDSPLIDEITNFCYKYERDHFPKICVSLNVENNEITIAGPVDGLSLIKNDIEKKINSLLPKPLKRSRKLVDHYPFQSKAIFETSSGIRIHCITSDIIHLTTVAILTSNRHDLASPSGLSKTIACAAGEGYTKECSARFREKGPLNDDDLVVTGAHRLPAKHVFHVIPPVRRQPIGHHDESFRKSLRRIFLKALHKAEELRLKSISMPLIGIGKKNASKEEVSELLYQAVSTFFEREGSIHDILIVTQSPHITRLMINHFRNHNSTATSFREIESESFKTEILPEPNSKSDATTVDRKFPERPVAGCTSIESNVTNLNCPICLETIMRNEVHTLNCDHKFCVSCIKPWLKLKNTCPQCGRVFGLVDGNQPCGTMDDHCIFYTLAGHENSTGTFEITFSFPSGIQLDCHPNPGVMYKGRLIKAFLPDSKDGRSIKRLLKIAFDSKQLFTIGQSMTTGRDDRITWNDIHLKTSKTGTFGYPDPTYLIRVKEELAAKGIIE